MMKQIRQEGLLQPGGRYVLALSGGCDSLSLLFLLQALQETEGYQLYAVHVNHGLRAEAEEDEAFCVRRCADLGVPISVFREAVAEEAEKQGIGLEECGRSLRYKRLFQTARLLQADGILTAHHREDQAETLLFQLLRGSGVPGLKGMPPLSVFRDPPPLIRPLLGISRQDLEACLRELGEDWREDASNRDDSYSRNFIRQVLMPACEARFSQAQTHMAAAAAHLEEVHSFMEEQAALWLTQHQKADTLPVSAFRNTHPALRFYIWRGFLEAGGLKDLKESHYRALKTLPDADSGFVIQLPGGRRILREQESIRLLWDGLEEAPETAPAFTLRRFPWQPDLKIPNTPYTKWIDYDIINNTVCLRHRQEGDYFYINSHEKKNLARFMVDQKIPLGVRDKIWILAQGSHVLWIVGYRLSYKARIGEGTKTVAEIHLFPEGELDEGACSKTFAFRGRSEFENPGAGSPDQCGL